MKRFTERGAEGMLDFIVGRQPAVGRALVAKSCTEVLILGSSHEKLRDRTQHCCLVVCMGDVCEQQKVSTGSIHFIHDLLVLPIAPAALIVRPITWTVFDGVPVWIARVFVTQVGPRSGVAHEGAVFAQDLFLQPPHSSAQPLVPFFHDHRITPGF